MFTEEAFFINYKGEQTKVSTVLDAANIYFSVHLPTTITIAEHSVEDEWIWYDINEGETPLAAELGELIEAVDA